MRHAALLLLALTGFARAETLSVLIVDGRNNHDWRETTQALAATLEHSGRFTVHVATLPEQKSVNLRRPKDPELLPAHQRAVDAGAPAKKNFEQALRNWRPDFGAHQAVVLNYNGPEWSDETKRALEDYVKAGGGLVLIHAANNAFSNWGAFNDMIGLGWRKANFGKCIELNPADGSPFATCADCNSGHGSKHAFQVTVRTPDHPIMRGIPARWMHAKDELYHNMRGPAENLSVLSSAFSDPKTNGTGEHEPLTWEVAYGKGRVIVTTMGHFWPQQDWWDPLYCVGFQTILARSTEYAATGRVTLPVPADFPGPDQPVIQAPWQTRSAAPEASPSAASAAKKKAANPYGMLSPEEEAATFELAGGYLAELVASEPQIEEPVLTVWDGNGAMYVAEMRSYMQDEKGTGTKTLKNGRIKRLVDTDGDGRMDQVSVFIDDLNLPRMILPLDDWIAVRETDTMDIIAYRDTDGDGVADETKKLYDRGPYGRGNTGTSVEHQDSGLVWNIDNRIYISYNIERYRYTDGDWQAEKQNGHWTQWGLDHDDTGRLFWIDNSRPLKSVQHAQRYWSIIHARSDRSLPGEPITLGAPYEPDFLKVRSLCLLNDRGGPAGEVRAFTSACGQSVFRGHAYPADSRGAYFFCDPTIHVVRRAAVTREHGKIMLRKPEDGDGEFLRSSDINARFVNTATAPDGTLYVTDMYRGIIQDAPWMSPGPRKFTVESGLAKNNRHGRIWRIRHRDYRPGPQPRMLDETTVELVRHLEHPNGWWRDTAQKLIILRKDRDLAVPVLEGLFRFSQNPKARLHALWTLDGMGKRPEDLIRVALKDRDATLRHAAIEIIESAGAAEHFETLAELVSDRDPRVTEQLIFTLGTIGTPAAEALIQNAARNHLADQGVMLATAIALWADKELPLVRAIGDGSAFKKLPADQRDTAATNWAAALANWERGLVFPKDMDKDHQRLVKSGEDQYFNSCVACHGADGTGMNVPGTDLQLAPSLVESKRVHGDPEKLIPVFVNGLIGPIQGKTYQAGFMAPAAALGIVRDDRLAEVISYIRYAWGGEGGPVDKETVKKLRQQHEARKTPWTEAELEQL